MMRLWNRLFGRKERPVIDRRQPNDWKPGDLAVCIYDRGGWWPQREETPERGEVLMVASVEEGVGEHPRVGMARAYFLGFIGKISTYESAAFRKAVIDHEPAEAEFTALIRRPVRPPAKVKVG